LTIANGIKYEGNFKNDLKHGKFEVTKPDGDAEEEAYENDVE